MQYNEHYGKVSDMSKAKLGLKRVSDSAIMPVFSTEHAACFDFSCDLLPHTEIEVFGMTPCDTPWMAPVHTMEGEVYFRLPEGTRAKVPLGWILDIPEGHSVRFYPRSGLGLKKGLNIANGTGVIDADYKQQAFALLHNTSKYPVHIFHGDRICQAEMVELTPTILIEVNELSEIESSRTGGMGSTGVGAKL